MEGQWVFGGIEEESRNWFIVCVDDRTEATLVSLLNEWVRPGKTIYSDFWKGYINLTAHGYIHETVNHSKEYVTTDGVHTNKIEGHWRHINTRLPTRGTKKEHFDSYIAEFIWRYVNEDLCSEDLFSVFL